MCFLIDSAGLRLQEAADALNGVPFDKSVRKASGFVKQCIEKALELGTPPAEGVPYELVLHRLRLG